MGEARPGRTAGDPGGGEGTETTEANAVRSLPGSGVVGGWRISAKGHLPAASRPPRMLRTAPTSSLRDEEMPQPRTSIPYMALGF